MRKFFLVALASLVFLFSAGFSFSVSFCPMSEEWSIAFFSDKACSCDTEEEDCCDQAVFKVSKIEDHFVPSIHVKLPTVKYIFYPELFSDSGFFSRSFFIDIKNFTPENPPPLLLPVYLVNRVLII